MTTNLAIFAPAALFEIAGRGVQNEVRACRVNECYTCLVRRFALSIIVALLAFSASGAYALVVAEPCTGYEQPGQEESACPPTCVTCGCCGQAAEPAILPVGNSLEALVTDVSPLIPRVSKANPRDILHVPKLRPRSPSSISF